MAKGLEVLEFKTPEEKIATLAFYILVNFPHKVATHRTFNVITEFVKGHFLSITSINQSLDRQLTNYQK